MTWISSVSRASVALLALFTSTSLANVTLPALFSEHAVLEKSARSVIWGQAEPGEQVTITLGSATARTQAGADGKWQTALDLRDQGAGPYELKVSGKNNLVVPDVVLGDVWICSGQSNMEFVLKNAIGAAEEIAQSANPMLRQFLVGRTASRQPLEQCTGHWVVAGPETSGGFTAVGYYFGKTLQKSLNVPIGLVHSSWGGTPCEAWTSIQGIDGDPDLKAGMERAFKTIDDFPAKKAAYIAAMTDWLKQHNREDHPADPAGFAAPAVSAAGWVPVPLPGPIAGEGLPPAGAFWLRKTVNLPPALDNKPLSVELENCNCFDTVYWNGEKFGATPVESYPGDGLKRRYNLPANLAKGGDFSHSPCRSGRASPDHRKSGPDPRRHHRAAGRLAGKGRVCPAQTGRRRSADRTDSAEDSARAP
jgi:sialate O-acetylesterase